MDEGERPATTDRPYAVIEDVPASWDRYERVASAVERAPPGLLLHMAGPTDEGFRIVEVWQDEGAWRRFAGDLDEALTAADPEMELRTVVRDLHAVHVAGAAWHGRPPDVSMGTEKETGR